MERNRYLQVQTQRLTDATCFTHTHVRMSKEAASTETMRALCVSGVCAMNGGDERGVTQASPCSCSLCVMHRAHSETQKRGRCPRKINGTAGIDDASCARCYSVGQRQGGVRSMAYES